ncbi:MAG: hypothetical protein MJE68_24055, partial [Proteobacteria bacterium]|nr:hypothetical protein [Pseudomonadota bacterium]
TKDVHSVPNLLSVYLHVSGMKLMFYSETACPVTMLCKFKTPSKSDDDSIPGLFSVYLNVTEHLVIRH